MAVYSVLPETNLKAEDIRDTIGGSNALISFFTSDAINKWARYKPQHDDSSSDLTDQMRAEGNWGLTNIPIFTRIGYMFNFMLGNTASPNIPSCGLQSEYFSYNRPRGTSASPYRLGDFRKYYVAAGPPVGGIGQSEFGVSSSINSITVVFSDASYGDYSLKLRDTVSGVELQADGITSSTGFYLGCAVINNSNKRFITQGSVISGDVNNLSFTFPFTTSMVGTYTAFLFMSNIPYTTAQTSVPADAGLFIPLTFTVGTITVKENIPAISLSLQAYKNTAVSSRLVYYNLYITNSGNESYNQYSVAVTVYSGTTVVGSDSYMTNSTVGANSTVSLEGKSVDVGNYLNRTLSIQVSVTIGGKTFTTSKQAVMETLPR